MPTSKYTAVPLKTLKALFQITNYSEQNQAIAIAVLVGQQPITPLANEYGVTRANVHKILKKISAQLHDGHAATSAAWIKATHHLPIGISREFTQWEASVQKLPGDEAIQAIDALQRAIFKCRSQLMK